MRDSGSFQASTRHEVKGLWFIVARKYLLDRHGLGAIEEMAATMPEELRVAMLAPLHSSWYPEEALQHALAAFHRVVARGSDVEYLAALEACTIDGVNRFFQLLIGMTSPAFVLRKCPVLWKFVRRGPGSVNVDATDTRALVMYRDFPYFEDRNYRLLMEGTLRAVAGLARGARALEMRTLRWDASSLDIEVVYG